MMIENMTRTNLNKYITKLEKCLQVEENEDNIKIYTKWHNDAIEEAHRRDTARLNYLRLYHGKK